MLPTDLPLTLDRTAPTPLAVQLADGLRAAATGGLLRVGDRLPATRALATTLGCSRTVTAACYEALHAEGWIAGRHGAGTFIVAIPGRPPTPRQEERDGEARELRLDLRPGTPWAAGLARADWRRAWRAAADAAPLTKPAREGLPEYRAAVATHLLRHRGLAASRGSVLATGGTTAALSELVAIALQPGDTVAIEEPGYPRAAGLLRTAGFRVVPVPVDGDGLVVSELPDRARAVYVTPAHQYPLGARMSAARRTALVAWARERGALVVEDDYDGELRHDGPPLPLLAALGPDVVAHLGTTSKILTQTLGVGWMVAPPAVHDAVCRHRELTGTGPAPAGQRVLVGFARGGALSRHLRRVRREMLARRDLLVDALRVAGLRVLGDRAGAHLVIELPSAEAARAAADAAAADGIAVDLTECCHLGPPGRHGVAVGFAAPGSRGEIEQHLPRLLEALTTSCSRTDRTRAPKQARAQSTARSMGTGAARSLRPPVLRPDQRSLPLLLGLRILRPVGAPVDEPGPGPAG